MPVTSLVLVVGGVLAVLAATQIWLLWRLSRMVAATTGLEAKVTQFGDALSLLTETSETGFRAVADELTRRNAASAPAPRPRASAARLKAMVKRGRSIAEIAAAEGISEGEVRLRLHLADPPSPKGTPPAGRKTRGESANALRA